MLGFIIGLFLGGILGVMLMALIVGGNRNELWLG